MPGPTPKEREPKRPKGGGGAAPPVPLLCPIYTVAPTQPNWGDQITLTAAVGSTFGTGGEGSSVKLVNLADANDVVADLTPGASWGASQIVATLPAQRIERTSYGIVVQVPGTAAPCLPQAITIGEVVPPLACPLYSVAPTQARWGDRITLTAAAGSSFGTGGTGSSVKLVNLTNPSDVVADLTPGSTWSASQIVATLPGQPSARPSYGLVVQLPGTTPSVCPPVALPIFQLALPCDVSAMTSLVKQAYKASPVSALSGPSAIYDGAQGLDPGTAAAVKVEALPSSDELVRLLLDTATVRFSLQLLKDGTNASQSARLDPPEVGSSQTILRFLPRPDVVAYQPQPSARSWQVQVHALVEAPNCPGPIPVVLAAFPFSLLPLAIPTVAFLFATRSYEEGFFVATPGIPGITNSPLICDDKRNSSLRADLLAKITRLVSTVLQAAGRLHAAFDAPFPSPVHLTQINNMLTKATARAASNKDFAIVSAGEVLKLGDIWLWWAGSCDNLVSSLFMISVPQGPTLSMWFDENCQRPSPPPQFQVPSGSLCASLTTLWSLDTDTVSALKGGLSAYGSWYKYSGTGDRPNFAYNETSSYRWTT